MKFFLWFTNPNRPVHLKSWKSSKCSSKRSLFSAITPPLLLYKVSLSYPLNTWKTSLWGDEGSWPSGTISSLCSTITLHMRAWLRLKLYSKTPLKLDKTRTELLNLVMIFSNLISTSSSLIKNGLSLCRIWPNERSFFSWVTSNSLTSEFDFLLQAGSIRM